MQQNVQAKNMTGNNTIQATEKKKPLWSVSGFFNLNKQMPMLRTRFNATKNYPLKSRKWTKQARFAQRKLNESKLLIKIQRFCEWLDKTILNK